MNDSTEINTILHVAPTNGNRVVAVLRFVDLKERD